MVLFVDFFDDVAEGNGFLYLHMCPRTRDGIEWEEEFPVLFAAFWEYWMVQVCGWYHLTLLETEELVERDEGHGWIVESTYFVLPYGVPVLW